jgi:hypothetical protein
MYLIEPLLELGQFSLCSQYPRVVGGVAARPLLEVLYGERVLLQSSAIPVCFTLEVLYRHPQHGQPGQAHHAQAQQPE